MSAVLEAVLVAVTLFSGYLAAAFVVLSTTPKQDHLPARLASAAIALTLLFAVCIVSFIASEYLMEQYPEFVLKDGEAASGTPLWLDSWNKVAENMVSEVWQIWVAALYFKHRPWPGSPESK